MVCQRRTAREPLELYLLLFFSLLSLGCSRQYSLGVIVNPGQPGDQDDWIFSSQLAVEEINRNTNAFQLKLEVNTAIQAYEVSAIAEDWLNNNSFVGAIGPPTSVGTSAVTPPFFPSTEFPFISPSATNSPSNTKVFRLALPDSGQAELIRSLVQRFEWTDVALFYTDDQYGQGGLNYLTVQLKFLVRFYTYAIPADTTQLNSLLLNATSSGMRAFILYALPTDALSVLSAASQLGFLSKGYGWIGSDGVSAIPTQSYANFSGLISIITSTDGGTVFQGFNSRFEARFGRKPKLAYSNSFYDSALIFGKAMSTLLANGGDPRNFSALSQTILKGSYELTKGSTTFLPNRQAISGSSYIVLNLVNGSFSQVAEWEAQSNSLPKDMPLVFPGNLTEVPGRVFRIGFLGPTSGTVSQTGQQYVSLFRIATDLINKNNSFLPNIHLEVVYGDSGTSRTVAMKSVYSQFLQKGVSAVIGTESSFVSEVVQITLQLEQIPQISPESTSDIFSDKTKFPYFARVVPPDSVQAVALASFVRSFGWKKVAVISTLDAYGTNLYSEFAKQCAQDNIQILASPTFIAQNDDTIDNQIAQIVAANPRIIVVLALPFDSLKVLKAAAKVGLTGPKYAWLGGDGMAGVGPADAASAIGSTVRGGIFATSPSTGIGDRRTEFEHLVRTQDPAKYPQMGPNAAIYPFAAHWWDAIFFVTSALRKVVFEWKRPLNGSTLLSAIANTTWSGVTGDINLNNNLDRIQNYDIFNMNNGTWVRTLIWSKESSQIVKAEYQYYFADGTSNPPPDSAPNEIIWYSFSSTEGIVITIFNSIALACSIAVLIWLVIHREHKVVRAASFLFLFLMLLGLFFGHILVYLFVATPADNLCQARPWIASYSFSLVFGSLFIKAYRVYRIFASSENLTVVSLPDRHLLMYLATFLTVPTIVLIVWTIADPLKEDNNGPSDTPNQSFKRCYSSDWVPYETTLYAMGGLVLLVGAALAFLSRHATTAYNESRWITLSIYNMIICSVIAIPPAYALKKNPNLQLLIMCIGIILALFGSLVLNFMTKIVAVYAKPPPQHSLSPVYNTKSREF